MYSFKFLVTLHMMLGSFSASYALPRANRVSAPQSCSKIYQDVLMQCQIAVQNTQCQMPVSEGGTRPAECNFSQCQVAANSAAADCQRQNQRSGGTGESSESDTSDLGFSEEEASLPGTAPVPGQRPGARNRNRTQAGGGNRPEGNNGAAAAGASDFSMQALNQEVQACSGSLSQAQKCCQQPEQCGASSSQSSYTAPPTNDPEGMKRYCEQLKYAGSQGQSENSGAAGVCFTNHNSCTTMCNNSKTKWEGYLSNCRSPSCDPNQVNQALSVFKSKSKDCSGLKELESALANQSGSSYTASQQSKYCSNQAGMDPSSFGDQSGSESDEKDCSGANASKPECVDCSKYPNSPVCMGTQNNTNAYNGSGLNEDSGNSVTQSSAFNVGASNEALPQFPSFQSVQAKSQDAKAIPNGGGGMGGMGGGSAGGGMNSASTGAVAEGQGGYNTDVLQGERSGGGASSSGGVEGGSGFGGYGSGGESFKNKYGGLDLKQYLPGGAKDPSRSVASTNTSSTMGHPEIAPPGVSMFNRISLRLSTMCKMKQLLGCN